MSFRELALFTGGGGGLLGSKLLGWRTICYVENEPYAVEIIKARIRDGMLDDAPIWDDARTFDGRPWAGCVDIVTAGFPCQPWSVAGKQLGENDERNLWPDTIRIIREVGPEWCLLENVPALLSKPYIQQIFGDLAESGYDTRWDCIPAAAVGAPHLRYRLWIVANSQEQHRSINGQETSKSGRSSKIISDTESRGERGLSVRQGGSFQAQANSEWSSKIISDTDGNEYQGHSHENWRETDQKLSTDTDSGRCEQCNTEKREISIINEENNVTDTKHDPILHDELDQKKNDELIWADRWYATEPGMGRVAHGVAYRVDRIRALGNGQVPGVVRAAWMLLARDFDHD